MMFERGDFVRSFSGNPALLLVTKCTDPRAIELLDVTSGNVLSVPASAIVKIDVGSYEDIWTKRSILVRSRFRLEGSADTNESWTTLGLTVRPWAVSLASIVDFLIEHGDGLALEKADWAFIRERVEGCRKQTSFRRVFPRPTLDSNGTPIEVGHVVKRSDSDEILIVKRRSTESIETIAMSGTLVYGEPRIFSVVQPPSEMWVKRQACVRAGWKCSRSPEQEEETWRNATDELQLVDYTLTVLLEKFSEDGEINEDDVQFVRAQQAWWWRSLQQPRNAEMTFKCEVVEDDKPVTNREHVTHRLQSERIQELEAVLEAVKKRCSDLQRWDEQRAVIVSKMEHDLAAMRDRLERAKRALGERDWHRLVESKGTV